MSPPASADRNGEAAPGEAIGEVDDEGLWDEDFSEIDPEGSDVEDCNLEDEKMRNETDSRTGEVLEDTSQVGEFVSQEFALRRLDKVRDIQVEVYVRDMREENLKPQPIEWSRLGPQERWGDIESD